MEACHECCGRECDVGIERRIQFEGPRLTREVPKPEQAPFGSALVCHRKLIAGDVEGRPFPHVCGLHLDQACLTVWREPRDIVAFTIPSDTRWAFRAKSARPAASIVAHSSAGTH